jgi:organic radical activating enzyme
MDKGVIKMNPMIRLIFTENCNRKCPGCCNKNYNFDDHPTWDINQARKSPMIMITGGEPMLYARQVKALIRKIQAQKYNGHIILYTALVLPYEGRAAQEVLKMIDGMTLTLHEQRDIFAFKTFNSLLELNGPYDKSLRLNVFEGVTLPDYPLPLWQIKKDRVWVDDCPLPNDEVIRVLR